MKSIKPGRGPSILSGISGIFLILIGIGWTIVAAQVHWLMMLFGICWTGIAITRTIYSFKNAKTKHRYSVYDVVDSCEEPDPLNERFIGSDYRADTSGAFCPYCGKRINPDYDFCPGCGHKLPD